MTVATLPHSTNPVISLWESVGLIRHHLALVSPRQAVPHQLPSPRPRLRCAWWAVPGLACWPCCAEVLSPAAWRPSLPAEGGSCSRWRPALSQGPRSRTESCSPRAALTPHRCCQSLSPLLAQVAWAGQPHRLPHSWAALLPQHTNAQQLHSLGNESSGDFSQEGLAPSSLSWKGEGSGAAIVGVPQGLGLPQRAVEQGAWLGSFCEPFSSQQMELLAAGASKQGIYIQKILFIYGKSLG